MRPLQRGTPFKPAEIALRECFIGRSGRDADAAGTETSVLQPGSRLQGDGIADPYRVPVRGCRRRRAAGNGVGLQC